MSVEIPFQPSIAHYTMSCNFDEVQVPMLMRWNSRSKAWYLTIYEPDGVTIVVRNAKLVLGVNIGRRSTHRFFRDNLLTLADKSGQRKDAGFDDMGTRVVCVRFSRAELINDQFQDQFQ